MSGQKWILLVEDDANDADLTVRVLWDPESPVALVRVKDGLEALDCLHQRGLFQSRAPGLPALLVLDLKMPRANGFDVLQRIKNDVILRTVPVMVFTSSREPSDLVRSYELGTNAYVVKPVSFHEFAATLNEIKKFWIDLNELPPGNGQTKDEGPVLEPSNAPEPELR